MYTIRPFEPTDDNYKTMETIWNAGHPDDQYTTELFEHEDKTRNPNVKYARFMIAVDSIDIAYGALLQNESHQQANKYYLVLAVQPDHGDQQGIRQFFHNFALDKLKDETLVAVAMSTREDYPDDLTFLKATGFEQKQRAPRSHLDVEAFDLSQWEAKVQAITDSGVEFLTAKQLKDEQPDNWQRLLYDLEVPVVADMPRVDEFVAMPFEAYVANLLGDPTYMPEANFLARDGDQLVGISSLWKDVSDEKLWVGLTGVLRSHRQRGIATALKVKSVQFAKAYGAKVIEADNEENNPMFQINLKLGFKPEPAYLYFEKAL